ncbi:MAG TPA: hypothetical protein VIE43_19675 [Thermoanaerobaculia bacterium]|jgi:hypothetical protein|nr:hypothetical protein [Thermoanaerobaculia bacterium]
MRRATRSLAFALTLLVLAAGAVHARPLAVHRAPAGILDTLWQWVSSYLPARTKEGGMMDPDGFTTKAGSTMDPDGLTHPPLSPPATTNAGGTMDPDG